jgi:hypothetical protein
MFGMFGMFGITRVLELEERKLSYLRAYFFEPVELEKKEEEVNPLKYYYYYYSSPMIFDDVEWGLKLDSKLDSELCFGLETEVEIVASYLDYPDYLDYLSFHERVSRVA